MGVKLVIGEVNALLLFPLLPVPAAQAAPKAPAKPGDFNGDGRADPLAASRQLWLFRGAAKAGVKNLGANGMLPPS